MKRILCVLIALFFLLNVSDINVIHSAWIKKKKQKKPSNKVKEIKQEIPQSVEFINAITFGTNKVKLSWDPLSEADIMALIYRDAKIINSKENLTADRFVSEISAAKGKFIDTLSKSGKYYYAIITKKNNVTNKELIEDQNYTSVPVGVNIPVIPSPVSEISARLSDNKKTIIISWKDVNNAKQYKIYRASEVINNLEKLKSAKLINTIEQGKEKFIDKSFKIPGRYYYAITTVNEAGENNNLFPEQNYTTSPVIVEVRKEKKKPAPVVTKKKKKVRYVKIKRKPKVKKKRISYESKFEKIIKKYYYTKKYAITIKELKKIIKSSASQNVKNKARLFLAKSYYYTGKYKKALAMFVKLKEKYPDESSFWIKQTLRKIR